MLRQLARLVLLGLFSIAAPAHATAQHEAPLVLAAASLQESMTAAADAWAAKRHPRPVISFAASSALARQVASGAPADLFVCADEPWMDYVEERGLIRPGSRVSFLSNRLVLVAPRASKTRLKIGKGFELARALGDGRLAIADPQSVPAGRYGKAALTSLGVWASVSDKLASAENVRAALAFVERGEAPFGIVYATDAQASKGVKVVGVFPASSHPPIMYPVAILKSAASPDAEGFHRFLTSNAGQKIFARYGFTPR